MIDVVLAAWSTWWDSTPADFVFLQVLPFAVAALALAGHALRRRCRERSGHVAAPPRQP